MKCLGWKFGRVIQAVCCLLLCALVGWVPSASAAIIVDDSWADGGRTNGADPYDTDWWTSTATSAIEVSVGSLGLVTGSSGRGIHGTFAPQSLDEGDSLKVTFAFTTPATVGNNLGAAFKVGLYDTLGDAGLAADLSASSGTPNPIYNPMPGYMMDFDVRTGTENIMFREKSPVPGSTGQLLGTTTGYANLAGGGDAYTIAANTNYVGKWTITRTALGLDLTGSLSDASGVLSTFTTSDATPSVTTFDLLAFHVNANVFGSSNVVGANDNGIDFTNIRIEYCPAIPEPSTAALVLMGMVSAWAVQRRRVS